MTSSSAFSACPEGYDDLEVYVTDHWGFPMGKTTVGRFRSINSVHQQEACYGQNCVLHAPSDHSMKMQPMTWRQDTAVMERHCTHGVGHPDPDHLSYVLSLTPEHECEVDDDYNRHCGYPHLEWQKNHGCDGCC